MERQLDKTAYKDQINLDMVKWQTSIDMLKLQFHSGLIRATPHQMHFVSEMEKQLRIVKKNLKSIDADSIGIQASNYEEIKQALKALQSAFNDSKLNSKI